MSSASTHSDSQRFRTAVRTADEAWSTFTPSESGSPRPVDPLRLLRRASPPLSVSEMSEISVDPPLRLSETRQQQIVDGFNAWMRAWSEIDPQDAQPQESTVAQDRILVEGIHGMRVSALGPHGTTNNSRHPVNSMWIPQVQIPTEQNTTPAQSADISMPQVPQVATEQAATQNAPNSQRLTTPNVPSRIPTVQETTQVQPDDIPMPQTPQILVGQAQDSSNSQRPLAPNSAGISRFGQHPESGLNEFRYTGHSGLQRGANYSGAARRRTGRPVRRTPMALAIAATVRQQLAQLVPHPDQIVPAVSASERAEYECRAHQMVGGLRQEATSEENFRFDVMGTRSSPWNKSAARVFAPLAIRNAGLSNTYPTRSMVESAFTSHLERIIRRYKHSLKSDAERLLAQSKSRRQTRRYELFLRRHETAHLFPPLHGQIPMLEEFGIDGMSCDESDREDEACVRYRISSPSWRADRVTQWLRTFDTVYRRSRMNAGIQAGALPRIRYSTNRKTESKRVVPSLPINAYDPMWLERNVQQHYDLCPSTEVYDFTPVPEVMNYILSLPTTD